MRSCNSHRSLAAPGFSFSGWSAPPPSALLPPSLSRAALWPRGLQPISLLCPRNFQSRTLSGAAPLQGVSPDPGIELTPCVPCIGRVILTTLRRLEFSTLTKMAWEEKEIVQSINQKVANVKQVSLLYTKKSRGKCLLRSLLNLLSLYHIFLEHVHCQVRLEREFNSKMYYVTEKKKLSADQYCSDHEE